MLIDINEIIVNDRIRKDFGNLEELAEDIKKNGLINPLTVDGDYKLLAGERRLRACKLLGWNQVEVNIIEVDDVDQALRIEISENEQRESFTNSERVKGMRDLMRAVSVNARDNLVRAGRGIPIEQPIDTRAAVAQQFGVSSEMLRRMLLVDENKNLLDPADFADWDEGKLSTNKAYRKIMAALRRADKSLPKAKAGWSTKAVRNLLTNPRGTSRESCFICHGHKTITELHHVIQVSELAELLNREAIGLSDVETPIVWLCPNCHAYVHAAMRGDTETVLPMTDNQRWRDGYEAIANARAEFASNIRREVPTQDVGQHR